MKQEFKDWNILKKIGYWILITPLIIAALLLSIAVILGLVGGLTLGWGAL